MVSIIVTVKEGNFIARMIRISRITGADKEIVVVVKVEGFVAERITADCIVIDIVVGVKIAVGIGLVD